MTAQDYTMKKGYYAKNLSNNTDNINNWYYDSTIDYQAFAQKVEQLLSSAYVSVTAKPRFLNALHRAKTKDAILFLCYNSILCAKGLAAI